jgi:type IV secretory pathway VirB10-like protein
MFIRRGLQALLLMSVSAGGAMAQDGTTAVSAPELAPPAAPSAAAPLDPWLSWRPEQIDLARPFVSLAVPKGTALVVAIDRDIRIEHVGQPIRARLVEPVYAFDKLVIPVGAAVSGRVTEIDDPSKAARTSAVLDANFSPGRHVEVEFDHLLLSGDEPIPMRTLVSAGSGQPIEFVAAAGDKGGSRDAVAESVKQATQEARQEWNEALKQTAEPGKMRRAERYAESQLPVHPQYIQAGTVYFAELDHPLDFGSEPLTESLASSIGKQPPNGSLVQARLITPLNSATSHPGDPVEAVLSRPLFDRGRLVLPQGSRIAGSVVQAQPAHHPGRNGQLRIVFRELQLPDGLQEKVAASLEGVESAKRDNVKLDSEGGARATDPPSRFLTTATAVGLGGAAFLGDSFGETGPRTAGAAGGYKLIGIALGLTIHSQPFGMAMGAFGAGRSIYGNFIARGHDVDFPKNTAVAIALWDRHEAVLGPAPGSDAISRE